MRRGRLGAGRAAVALGLLAIVVASCGGGGSSAPDTSRPDPTTTFDTDTDTDTNTADTGTTEAAPTTEAPSDVPPAYDVEELLARDDLVVFNAYPPKPDDVTYPLPPGQRDFDELWEPDAPWQEALSQVDVYRLHAFQMRHFMDDDQIVRLVEFLREHEIPLMFETEPLQPVDPDVCDHTESFEGPWDLEMAERLHDLGGRIDVIAIEEPFHYAYLLDTEGACRYTLERIVDEVMLHVERLRELFGPIPVGTIEPIWSSPATTPDDLALWLDTFEAMSGESFAFLHLDPDWYRDDWAEVAAGVEAVADERGVPLGVLYNGGTESDGLTWMNFMMANAAELEVVNGVTPQHVSFQSWVDLPDHALPETDLTALTSGIVRYGGERLALDLTVEASGDLVAGVTDAAGDPVAGVELRAEATTDGSGLITQIVRGIVPAGAGGALALVRANAEGGLVGNADVVLHRITVTDGVGGPNLVPNSDFADGLADWGAYGSAPGGVTAVATSTGQGMAIRVAAGQDAFVDGTVFAVTPGREYEFTVAYELAGDPASVVVSVEFLDVARTTVVLDEGTSELGPFTTDADGRVRIGAGQLAGVTELELRSSGDLERWPVVGSIELG